MTGSAAALVTQNALVLTTLKVAAPALSMLVVLVLSRMLGAEGLGRYTVATTFLGFMTAVTPLGLNAFLMREGARELDTFPKVFANTVALTVAVSVVAALCFPLIGFWLNYDDLTRQALTVVSLAVVPATLLTLCDAIFIARHRSVYIGIYTIADLLVRVGLALLLLLWGYNIVAVLGALVAAQFVALAAAARLSGKLGVPLRLNVDMPTVRRLLSATPTFLSISIFATLFWQIDVIMLSAFSGMREVGLFGAAYRVLDLVRILPQSLCMAVYPLVSRAAVDDREEVRRIGTATLRVLWMATIPIVVGGTILAGPLLAFIVGEEFRAAGMVLAVLLWTAIPYTLVRYYSYVIVAANRERIDLALNVGLAAVNIALNLVLVPSYGAMGAAVSTLISMCLFAAVQYLYVSRRLASCLSPLQQMLKPAAAAGLMALFVWVRREDHVVVLIAAAAIVYVSLLLLTRSVSLRELRLLRRNQPAALLHTTAVNAASPGSI
jgi:O-antigen/teichoic acid export membrane protein